MSAHDRYLADHYGYPVRAICQDCGEEWDDQFTSEYGQGSLTDHEDCPKCGGTRIEFDQLDEIDIQERKLEARGIDF